MSRDVKMDVREGRYLDDAVGKVVLAALLKHQILIACMVGLHLSWSSAHHAFFKHLEEPIVSASRKAICRITDLPLLLVALLVRCFAESNLKHLVGALLPRNHLSTVVYQRMTVRTDAAAAAAAAAYMYTRNVDPR